MRPIASSAVLHSYQFSVDSAALLELYDSSVSFKTDSICKDTNRLYISDTLALSLITLLDSTASLTFLVTCLIILVHCFFAFDDIGKLFFFTRSQSELNGTLSLTIQLRYLYSNILLRIFILLNNILCYIAAFVNRILGLVTFYGNN